MLLFNTVWAFISLVFCVTLALVFEGEFPLPIGAEGDAQDRRKGVPAWAILRSEDARSPAADLC